MEKAVFPTKEQQLQDARDCLQEHDNEIELTVDSGRGDYEFARISVLMKSFKLDRATAKNLLREVDNTRVIVATKVEEVQKSVEAIQEDPYEKLIQEFTVAYNNFLVDHNLGIDSPIPEILKNTDVFEFPKNKTETHKIPLWLAHMLLNPHTKMDPQAYFKSVM